MKEEWLDIKGFENYRISNLGRVYSKKRKIILNPGLNTGGYCFVILYASNNKHTKLTHRLAAETFIPNPLNNSQVNHKDGNRINNNIDNLEWVTRKENHIHARDILKTIKCKPVIGIHIKTGEQIEFKSIQEAERNGFNRQHINSCCNEKYGYRTHKEYIWKYL